MTIFMKFYSAKGLWNVSGRFLDQKVEKYLVRLVNLSGNCRPLGQAAVEFRLTGSSNHSDQGLQFSPEWCKFSWHQDIEHYITGNDFGLPFDQKRQQSGVLYNRILICNRLKDNDLGQTTSMVCSLKNARIFYIHPPPPFFCTDPWKWWSFMS